MRDATLKVVNTAGTRRAEMPSGTERPKFEVWKTIKLGMYSDARALLSALHSSHCCIGDGAETVMKQNAFALTSKVMEVDLAKVSAKQLGFRGNVYYGNICNRGIEQGLQPWSMELGAQLRRQYKDQPEGEILRIVTTQRVTDRFGRPRIFSVFKHGGRSLLDVCGGWNNLCFDVDDLFVWVLPRK